MAMSEISPSQVLLKASYNEAAKCVAVEAKLDKGRYRLVADVEGDTGEFGRCFVESI